MSMDSNKFLSK